MLVYIIYLFVVLYVKKTVVVGGANFDFRDDVFSRFQCCERANCLVQEMIRIQCGDDRLFFFSFYFDLE